MQSNSRLQVLFRPGTPKLIGSPTIYNVKIVFYVKLGLMPSTNMFVNTKTENTKIHDHLQYLYEPIGGAKEADSYVD